MWEKSHESDKEKQELYPQARVSPKARQAAAGDEQLLFVQVLLCGAIVAFLLFSRAVDAPWLPVLRRQCGQMLTQGVEFSTDNQMARLASQTVERLRMSARDLLEQLEATRQTNAEKTELNEAAQDATAVQDTTVDNTATAQDAADETTAAQGVTTEQDATAAQGGLWPVKQRQVPAGASLEEYHLAQTLQLPVEGVLTSPYGFRTHPITGEDDFHMGVDIAAALYTSVGSALDGQVIKTAYNSQRGNYLIVRHANGVQTLYQHLSYVLVRTGETVRQGQVLGTVGSTGVSTGPHLHFELILNGTRVDPALSLPGLEEASA